MRNPRRTLVACVVAVALLGAAGTRDARGQDAASGPLEQQIQSLLPTESEQAFREIPWRLNLMEARAAAAAQGRPIFLWIMNGHPFGCT